MGHVSGGSVGRAAGEDRARERQELLRDAMRAATTEELAEVRRRIVEWLARYPEALDNAELLSHLRAVNELRPRD